MIFTIDFVEYTYISYKGGVIITSYTGSDQQNIVVPSSVTYQGVTYNVIPSDADAPSINDKYIYQISGSNSVTLISMPSSILTATRDYVIPPTVEYNGIVYNINALEIFSSQMKSFSDLRYHNIRTLYINATKTILYATIENSGSNLQSLVLNTIENIHDNNLAWSWTKKTQKIDLLCMPSIVDISGMSFSNIESKYIYVGGNYNNNIFYMNGNIFRFNWSIGSGRLQKIFKNPAALGWPTHIDDIPVESYNPVLTNPTVVTGTNQTYTFDSTDNRYFVNKLNGITFDFTIPYPEAALYEWFIGDPENHASSRSTGVTRKTYEIQTMGATYACQYYNIDTKKYYKLEDSLSGGSQTPYDNVKLYCKITCADGITRYTTTNPNIIMIEGNILPINSLYFKIETANLAKVIGVEGNPTEITIPEKVIINNINYYVKSIDSGVFQNKTSITTLNIPYIEEIGSSAFYGCTNLDTINQNGYLTNIGPLAFQSTKIPVIIQHPLSQTALKGSTVTLRVVAQSSYNPEQNLSDYSFRWLDSAGNEISDSADMSGSQTDTLIIKNIKDTATYYPKIIGPFGMPFPNTTNANAYPSTPTTITVVDPATATPGQLKTAFELGNVKTTAFPITISGKTYDTFAANPDSNNSITIDLIAGATGTKPSKVKLVSLPSNVARVAIGVPSVDYDINNNPTLSLQVNLFNKNGKDLHDFNTSPIKFQVAFPAAFTAPSLEVKTLNEQGDQQDVATATLIDSATNTYEVTLKHFSEQQFSQTLSSNKSLTLFKINNIDCLTQTSITLPASAISLDISAITQDSTASYEVSGNVSSDGQWPRTIDLIVTAQDNSKETYSRTVNRQLAPITIQTQSSSQLTAYVGDTLTLNVSATSTLPLSYIWQKESSTIAIKTTPTLTLTNITLDSSGTYKVIPYNIQEKYDVSASTLLTVLPANQDTRLQSATINGVNVLQQYYNVIVPYGTSPSSITFAVVTSNSNAQYNIRLPNSFSIAHNLVYIDVTAADGVTTTTYSFVVIMADVQDPTPGSGDNVPCFPEGTKVKTSTGLKAVEDLNPDSDKIVTHDNRKVSFKLYKTHIARTTKLTAPYLLPANSLADNVPQHDLFISPLHAVQLRPGLWHIPKYAALSNKQITQPTIGTSVTYYHIELPNYFTDNIIAEGTVVESFAANQIKGIQNIYKYNTTLQGFTRASKKISKYEVLK